MKNLNIPIIGAIITALLSTLCCLPAFLFIFFGISSGVLTYFTTLEQLRVPMALLTVLFFIFGIKRLKRKISCKCTQKEVYFQYISFFSIFFLILFLLFYPEIIPLFMD